MPLLTCIVWAGLTDMLGPPHCYPRDGDADSIARQELRFRVSTGLGDCELLVCQANDVPGQGNESPVNVHLLDYAQQYMHAYKRLLFILFTYASLFFIDSPVSEYAATNTTGLTTTGNLLELGVITVEDLRVATESVLVAVLPEALERPVVRDGAGRRSISSKRKRALVTKAGSVASASVPPVSSGVKNWILRGGSPVRLSKVRDPSNHLAVREAVAGRAVGVVLDIKHAGEGNAVARPAAAVLEEVVGLHGTRGDVGTGKVVAAANEAGVGGADVVVAKGRVDEAGAFSGLDRGRVSE